MTWLAALEAWGLKYPELTAMLAGSALSWAPGLVLETWFLPLTWTDRKVKQVTLGVTVAVAAGVSALLWHWFDPADKAGVVWLVSGAAALSAPAIHVVVAKILTHFFPYLDSVFQAPPTKPKG